MLVSRNKPITVQFSSIDTMKDGEINGKAKAIIATLKNLSVLTTAAVLNQIIPVSCNSS